MLVLALLTAVTLPACRTSAKAEGPAPTAGEPDATGEADETPAAEDYRVRFEGNDTLSDGALEKAIIDDLRDFERGGYPKFAIDDAAFGIMAHYQERGFPFAEVDYDIDRSSSRIEVLFRIVEGPRTRVETLTFEGLTVLERKPARAFFRFPEDGFLQTGEPLFVESRFATGASRLAGHLRVLGYLRARVETLEPEFSASRDSVRLHVLVEEGLVHRIRGVELALDPLDAEPADAEGEAGDDDPDPFLGEGGEERLRSDPEIVALLQSFIDQPYTSRRELELSAKLQGFFLARGYPDAAAVVVADIRDTGEVTLAARVTPGPLVHIGEIAVDNAGVTRGSFIRSRLRLRPGDRFRSTSERESFRRLYSTGLFRRVDLSLEGTGETRDLRVHVEESDSIDVFVEPGLGSYEGPRLRAGFTERNLFGTGRSFDATGKISSLATALSLGVTDPWFLRRDLEGRVSLSVDQREEPAFEERRTALGLGVGHEFWRGLEARVGFELSRSELIDAEVETLEDDDLDLAILFGASSWDTRNQFFTPKEGGLVQGRVELAEGVFGSSVEFVRFSALGSRFLELREGSVLALVLEAGVAFPQGSTSELPLQERFFAGGERSVRAFMEDELGPRDASGDPIGGEGFTRVSVEWRQKLVGNLQGALFGDAGTVSPRAQDVLEFEDIEGGVGLGLRYLLPIGPLRFDGAFRLGPDDERDDFVLHISVGMPF